MPVSLNGTSGLTFNDASTQNTAATGFGFKNRILNGQMVLDQRNAGASVTPTITSYTLDRWQAFLPDVASTFSIQQSSTAPTGFTNSLLVTSLSAHTVASTERFAVRQMIEGFNIADLGWGTANAQTVTLSFWVRSSLTGTIGGAIQNSAADRSYPFSWTMNSANTFEQKFITIAGDTSGTWLTTNGVGIRLFFNLGAGSTYTGTAGAWAGANYLSATGATNLVATSGATFYITGVQLEKGSTATSFDVRPYGTELQLCQRYYQKITSMIVFGYNASGANILNSWFFPVTLRAAPTIVYSSVVTSNTLSVSTNLTTPNLLRCVATVVSTGGAYSTFDIETSGTEL
jgi:hypothetical protein